MLSRVADSIYWMSRYVERAENVARFVDVNLNLMLDSPSGEHQQWQPLVNITGDHADFEKRYPAATQHDVIQFLTFDRDNPNSIISCLRSARENARSVREVISSEMCAAKFQQALLDGELPRGVGRGVRARHAARLSSTAR